MREDRFIGQDTVVDKYHAPLASYQMTTRDYVLRPDATAGAMTVTLPPVSEARGRFYSIVAEYASNTDTITITANGSEVWPGDVVLNEKARGEVFYSDGMKWVTRSFGDVAHITALAAGAVNIRTYELVNEADNPTGPHEVLKATLTSLANRTGAWANAVVGKIDYTTSGSANGMAAAVCGDMIPPNGSLSRGALYCMDFAMGPGAASSWGGAGPVAFALFQNYGTQAYFDDNAYFFVMNRVLEGAGHLLSLNAQTLKCQINGLVLLKERYVVLSIAENILDHATNVVSGSYGMRSVGTVTDGASEGGAAYFQCNVAGTPSGNIFGTGLWMNINSAPGARQFRAVDAGVWTDQDLTGVAEVVGMNIDMHLGAAGAPTGSYMMRFNSSGHAVTAWFRAASTACIGYAAVDPTGGGAAADGRIAIYLPGGIRYLATYDA